MGQFIEVHSTKYQIVYDRLLNRYFNNEKLYRYIEIKNFIKAECGLKKCLETFLKDKQFNKINWGLEAKKDRLTNEKTQLKEIKEIKQKIKYLVHRYKK